jgi:predicted nucleic acid-binding protein
MSRSVGITPRGLIDCLIVAIALRTGATVLTADRDVRRLAELVDVGVVAEP